MNSNKTLNIKTELQNYGVASSIIRLFRDAATPELLDYLDLVEPRGLDAQQELLPDGVAESQGHPLLFFVNESRLLLPSEEKEVKFDHLRRSLACRGDRAYLARILPGELRVTPVNLADRTPEWRLYRANSGEAITFFSRLAEGYYDGKGEPSDADFVFKEMFNLLNCGIDRIAHRIGWEDVLSLVGRALFFRFLKDRQIVTERDTKRIAPQANELLACFDNAENAYATSQWLDRTFNGDFLPLRDNGNRAFFLNIAGRSKLVFGHLSAIVRGLKPVGSEDYQIKFSWNDFNFAHVPVGLLSQVYEAFCWKWEHRNAKETSVHYTPRRVAATLVDEAFDSLPNAADACVLDPACGAGIFLVLALRRLYRERWKTKRPDTKVIREILERQLAGFDISDSALKLSALSLYLTAIELDPEPIPPEKLRFKALNNLVLFNHRRQGVDPAVGPVIGSLGDHVSKQFDGHFDLVLSNPPWTSLPKKHGSLADQFTEITRDIIERKGEVLMAREYQNPDFAPDLPFLWKSSEWCKRGGRVAMVLPARILLKQEDIPRRARETIFRLLDVTGIINGSNLSDTEVWPTMSQPFLLFFARNQRPKDGNVIRLITMQYDAALNGKGEVRIDSKSIQPVEVATTFDEPWLWKALAVGTPIDVEVIRRINAAGGKPLKHYWGDDLGLNNSSGYMIKPDQAQKVCNFIRGLPNLAEVPTGTFAVDISNLPRFNRSTACRPRNRAIYRAPLALIKQAPGPDRTQGWALLSFDDVAFNQSLHGYSGAGNREGNLLVRYLHLFAHSNIRMYYALTTRPRFGSERRVLDKGDLDQSPIIPLSKLSMEQRDTVLALSKRLVEKDKQVFEEIDSFFGHLYGLDKLDLETIRDTLDVCLPYNESRIRACRMPTGIEREVFRRRLEAVLRPFFKVLGKEPQVVLWKPDDSYLWKESLFNILIISEAGSVNAKADGLFRSMILKLADETGTTRILQRIEGGLLVGLLAQYRYWTTTRARLLGAEIVRQHMDIFEE